MRLALLSIAVVGVAVLGCSSTRLYQSDHPVNLTFSAQLRPAFLRVSEVSLDIFFGDDCERSYQGSVTLRSGDYPRGMCCAECDGPLYPYMVVPHEAYRGRITALWDLARESLVDASELVIVGYSFPDYDQRVCTLLIGLR